MKKMLILGGTKGIGKSCSTYFKDKGLDVITIARTNSDINGDLTNTIFQDTLIKKIIPDILICSAGKDGAQIEQGLSINFSSIARLIMKYFLKMPENSNIINISSLAALHGQGFTGNNYADVLYNSSKHAISNFCISLARSRQRNVHVSTIEPEYVLPTNFSLFHQQQIDSVKYEKYDFNSFTPIRPIDIAKTIDWIISQPPWMNICRVTINNHYLHNIKKNEHMIK